MTGCAQYGSADTRCKIAAPLIYVMKVGLLSIQSARL
jgi:hypothetical protein